MAYHSFCHSFVGFGNKGSDNRFSEINLVDPFVSPDVTAQAGLNMYRFIVTSIGLLVHENNFQFLSVVSFHHRECHANISNTECLEIILFALQR